ncbi:MAG TPA: nickel/cobalt transporter [Nitrososphaeraceae archaeon]|nr:nickel/cobalt transporter [Nitrososphaeraceae archaeon]
MFSSIASSGIIAGAHFLSSIAVVLAFIFVTTLVQIPQTYMNYAVAIALGILAFMFWREKSEDLAETQHGHLHHENTDKIDHEHSHWHKETGYHTHLHVHHQRVRPTLAAIAGFALVLGFAHEEEFVILSLAIGGVNPILLMVAYASSVAIALIGITVLVVKVYMHFQDRVISYTKYLPKISALVLAAMAVSFAFRLL